MKRTIILIAAILSISGCGDSRSIQERKNRLMFDCQCEPGTYEYSYRLAGLLIEEQKDAKNYVEINKSKFVECAGMKDKDYELLLKKIDDNIDYNKKTRPYYLTKLFFGESQVRDITTYKEAQLDLLVKSLENACTKSKNKEISVNPVGNNPSQLLDNNSALASTTVDKKDQVTNTEQESQSAKNQTNIPSQVQTPQKLSAAAEKAIQEGFVDIKNPAVQACTDARIKAIKKEIGEDSPINYEIYNEAAVKCGFNI